MLVGCLQRYPYTTNRQVPEGTVVAIYVEGKEHALAVGITLMSSETVRTENKGHAIQTLHNLGDALWNFSEHKKK